MVVELRDLRWAVVAAQHRSLRQAAEALNVRQSTLSRGLRALEHQLGATLFERTNGGTKPSLLGQELLDAARHVLDETEAIIIRFKTRSEGGCGRLAIGIHTSLSAGNLRATFIDFRRRFPNVEAYLIDGSSDHLISNLMSSAIDVAFVTEGNPRWSGNFLAVWSERVVVALPEDHILAGHQTVHWSDLKQQPMFLPQRGPGPEFHQLLTSKLGGPGPCHFLYHDVSLDRLLSLVGAGWGILLVLEGATGAAYPGVTFREVHDADGPTRMNFRAYWRETNGNPSLHPFLDMLRERYPDLSGG